MPYWAALIRAAPSASALTGTAPAPGPGPPSRPPPGPSRRGRRPRPDVLADLAVVDLDGGDAASTTASVSLAARALRGGGILAVLTRCQHDRADDHGDKGGAGAGRAEVDGAALSDVSGAVVASAQNADLLYLQHIVIPTRPLTSPDRADGAGRGTDPAEVAPPSPVPYWPRHPIAHADLLIFARPAGLTAASRPDSPPPPARPPCRRPDRGAARGRSRGADTDRSPAVTPPPQRHLAAEPSDSITDPPPPAGAPRVSSVWATAQASPAAQRRGRYVPESSAHPAKMLPAVAAHAITHYTRPGDLVMDPMCGIGTTLVEAVHLGRRAVGVEYETRWAHIARANLDLAGPAAPRRRAGGHRRRPPPGLAARHRSWPGRSR